MIASIKVGERFVFTPGISPTSRKLISASGICKASTMSQINNTSAEMLIAFRIVASVMQLLYKLIILYIS